MKRQNIEILLPNKRGSLKNWMDGLAWYQGRARGDWWSFGLAKEHKTRKLMWQGQDLNPHAGNACDHTGKNPGF